MIRGDVYSPFADEAPNSGRPVRPAGRRAAKGVGLVCIAALMVIALVRRGESIPAFARTYETSCVTCHRAYPQLNSFGESFRINGFTIPGDEGESVKDEPVELGDEAYKRVWPKAVWPGTLPNHPPVAFRAKTGLNYGHADSTLTFDAPVIQLLTAGTLGEKISWYAGAHLFEHGVPGTVDRLYLKFNNLFTSLLPEHALYLRVGQFIPEIVTFASNHRGPTITAYAFNTYSPEMDGLIAGHAHGDGPFGIENFQIGAEASGVVVNRLRYVFGVVNGNGPNTLDNNREKDIYGRLAARIGPSGFMESEGTTGGSGSSRNGLNVGGFFYKGAKPNPGYVSPDKLDFVRYGADVSLEMQNFLLLGGYIGGIDEAIENTKMVADGYYLLFGEASYAVFPWLVPLLRYELAQPEDRERLQRLIAHLSILIRANVRVVVESPLELSGGRKFRSVLSSLEFSY